MVLVFILQRGFGFYFTVWFWFLFYSMVLVFILQRGFGFYFTVWFWFLFYSMVLVLGGTVCFTGHYCSNPTLCLLLSTLLQVNNCKRSSAL